MLTEPWVLGVGASHNGSACLLRGAELVVAVQEERLSGVKRDVVALGSDALCVRYCLDAAGIGPGDLDVLAVSALPSFDAPENDLAANPLLGPVAERVPVVRVGHHLAHAASAVALSGWPDAAVLVIDGAGSPSADLEPAERDAFAGAPGCEAVSMYEARGGEPVPVAKQPLDGGWIGAPNGGMRTFGSLGGMYSAVAEQVFGDKLDAGKVMGLAPYGRPTIPVAEFLAVEDGEVRLSDAVCERFRHHDRWPQRSEHYADLAASVQAALEVALEAVARDLRQRCPGPERLCYAGGVALNITANQKVLSRAGFDETFIVPAAEDSGVAIGAAYVGLWRHHHAAARPGALRRDGPGRAYGDGDVERALARTPAVRGRREPDLLEETCRRLAAGQVVGWVQGGAELGPRALGQRSILCDPRQAAAKERLNAKVKYREPFRPFAPVLPEAEVHRWFVANGNARSPFMLSALPFRADRAGEVPAVVHADGTGRLQTVAQQDHPRLHRLLETWQRATGVPILINTSFNLAGEPIVETPEDAVRCLLSSGIDAVVIDDWIVTADAGASLLDLRPVRAAARAQADDPAVAVRALGVVGEPGVPYRVDTRWGSTTVFLQPGESGLVEAAGGGRTGRELLAEHLPQSSDRAGLRALHRLGRLGVLAFEPA